MFEFASVPVAYLLWAVFGLFGGHRFYVGRWESGLVYMFTLGGCFVGWIIDGFILPQLVEDVRFRGAARLCRRGFFFYSLLSVSAWP